MHVCIYLCILSIVGSSDHLCRMLWSTFDFDKQKIPSATDVHKYMLKRAEHSPYRQAVLIELRYAEISKLMRMSAKVGPRGSVEIFLTSIRFALTLWTTTHAVEYVRLGIDLLMFMKCASPAMRALYANEMFTMLSATEQPEHVDLHMEGTVKHMRKGTGKVDRPGMPRTLEYECEEIPKRPTEQNVKQSLRTGSCQKRATKSRTHERITETSPAELGYNLVHFEMEFWHPTEEPIIGRDDKNNPI